MLWRQLPNLITAARLVLAGVFFTLLSFYQFQGRGSPWLLNMAFVVYLVALISDYYDGYLARKWKIESAFGRIVDPFVDKILVLGSFIFFAGKNFVVPEAGHPYVMTTITNVTPIMVIVLLGRELLVTSFRGLAESQGLKFGAEWAGKLKMVIQSVTVLVIVLYVNILDWVAFHYSADALANYRYWAGGFRNLCIWTTLIVTIWSGWAYLSRGMKMIKT